MPSAFSFASRGAARSRLALKRSDDFAAILSMRGLRLQSVVDVVALPARLLVVDLHVERQGEFAVGKHRIEMGGQRLEDMFSGLLAGGEVAARAKPKHHVEKSEIRTSIGDRVVLAANAADTDAAEWKDPGFDRGLADDFDDLADVEPCIEIGGIFEREMRHVRITPAIFVVSGEVAAHRAIGTIVGLNGVAPV